MRPLSAQFRLSALLLASALGGSAMAGQTADKSDGDAADQGVVATGSAAASAAPTDPVELVEAPYIGLFTDSIPLARGAELKLPEGTGLDVLGVAPNSPAAKAGLRRGDVLAKLDDQLLVNPAQLRVLARLHKPGAPLAFEVLRGGGKLTLQADPVLRPMPALTPGGQEQRIIYPPTGASAGSARILRIAPGEQPIPPEMLKEMPKELREQIERMNGGAAGSVNLHGGTVSATFSSRMVSQDGRHVFEVEHGRREHLRITEKAGKELYDGPIPADDKAWEKVPEEVRTKAKERLRRATVQIKESAPPPPALPSGK